MAACAALRLASASFAAMASSCARVGSLFFLGIVRSSCLGVGARGRGWRLLPEGSNHRLGEPFPRLDVGDMGRRDGGRLYACAGEFLFESVHSIPFRWASLPFCLGAPARGRGGARLWRNQPPSSFALRLTIQSPCPPFTTVPGLGAGEGRGFGKISHRRALLSGSRTIHLPALHYSIRPRGRGLFPGSLSLPSLWYPA